VFAVAFGGAILAGSSPVRAEKKIAFSKLTDPAEFALARELLSPHVKPSDYDPSKHFDFWGKPWPDTLDGFLRAAVHFGRGDLNDDGVDEMFYYFEGPGYCGSAGCWTLIFEKRDSGWIEICGTSAGDGLTITDWVSKGGYRELQDRYVIYWRNGECHNDAPRTPETEDIPPRGERTWKPIR
jgi:hypothetical protein